jgi:hypothetical protein
VVHTRTEPDDLRTLYARGSTINLALVIGDLVRVLFSPSCLCVNAA